MKKYINFNYIIIAALVVVIVYLLTCKKKVVEIEPVTPVAVQKEILRIDSIPSKKYKDSVEAIILSQQKEAEISDESYANLADRYNAQAAELNEVMNQPVPDTCKPYMLALNAANKRLDQSNKDKDLACNRAVNSQKALVASKNSLLRQEKKDKARILAALDTCFKNQSVAERNYKKLAPKRSIGVGIMSEAAWVQPIKFDMGVQLYYRGKNGNQLSLGVMTSQRGFVSYSKDLFKFK